MSRSRKVREAENLPDIQKASQKPISGDGGAAPDLRDFAMLFQSFFFLLNILLNIPLKKRPRPAKKLPSNRLDCLRRKSERSFT